MRDMSDLMGLSGRVAAITGGAGHIGRAMASALAELGGDLCLIDRPGAPLQAACNELRDKWKVRVEPFAADLEDGNARREVANYVREYFGRVDVLVNNAGFVGESRLEGWAGPLEEQSIDTWRRCLEVNLTASFHLSQLLAPALRASGYGSIINVASIYGAVGPDLGLYEGTQMGNPAAYAASKGALIQLTRWLATTLAPHVRVNCISPGGVFRNQPGPFVDRYIKRTPLARMGREEDFKGAVAYFASDLSSWVTGQNLFVDGGWTAW